MRVCFFVGPSVPRPELEAACHGIDADVQLLPPVQQGDLLRLHDSLPDVIGIIDGFFFQVPSILHKEILWAMERGIRVLGAASIGALRATELDVFGMEGIGDIYRMYKQGIVDADDEVAVPHTDASDGFRPLGDALINIRHNLRRAVNRRIVSARTASRLVENARRVHFTQRTYQAVLTDAARLAPGEVDALRRFLSTEAVDLKRSDALLLVQTVGERIGAWGTWKPAPIEPVNHTIYLHLFRRQYTPEATVLGLQKLLSPAIGRLFRRIAVRCLAVDEALERGLTAESPDVLGAVFRERLGLLRDDDYQVWLRERSLTQDEVAIYLRERDLEKRILALYAQRAGTDNRLHRLIAEVTGRFGLDEVMLMRPPRMRPGVPWEAPLVRELKVRGRYRAAVKLADEVLRVNAELAERLPGLSAALSPERLKEYVANLWDVDVSDVPPAMFERGFTDYAELLEMARLAFVAERAASMTTLRV